MVYTLKGLGYYGKEIVFLIDGQEILLINFVCFKYRREVNPFICIWHRA